MTLSFQDIVLNYNTTSREVLEGSSVLGVKPSKSLCSNIYVVVLCGASGA